MEAVKRMRDRAAAKDFVTAAAKDALLETASNLEKMADETEAWLQQIGGGRAKTNRVDHAVAQLTFEASPSDLG